MANRGYLCASDKTGIYPSFSDPDYEPKTQTLLESANYFPVFWSAMFRPANFVETVFNVNGQEYPAWSVVAEVEACRENVIQADKVIRRAFPGSDLNGYADKIVNLIESVSCKYMTIELEEIEALFWHKNELRVNLEGILKAYDENTTETHIYIPDSTLTHPRLGEKKVNGYTTTGLHEALCRISSIDQVTILRPAEEGLTSGSVDEDWSTAAWRMLGYGYSNDSKW